jgi:release factor glutamine methyltransferase
MTVKEALTRATGILAAASIEDASLESSILLRHFLNLDRVKLYLEHERQLTGEEEASFFRLIERRSKGEPTAYITHHREFYGLDFYVDSRVLIPRPESEILVEEALHFCGRHTVSTVADIGTGSGAIIISLAIKLPGLKYYATDISQEALEVAAINCEKNGVKDKITLLQGDMLDPLPEKIDLIIANLPYVKRSDISKISSGEYEPSSALDGGLDGLDKILRLCHQAKSKLQANGCLLLEVGMDQSQPVAGFLKRQFPAGQIKIISDYSDIERVVGLILSGIS